MHAHKFECKFCKEEVKNTGIRCPICGKYQRENTQNEIKNKIIDIDNRRVFDFAVGQTIKKVTPMDHVHNFIILIFNDNTWMSISAISDPFERECIYGEAEVSYYIDVATTKEEYEKLGLWD